MKSPHIWTTVRRRKEEGLWVPVIHPRFWEYLWGNQLPASTAITNLTKSLTNLWSSLSSSRHQHPKEDFIHLVWHELQSILNKIYLILTQDDQNIWRNKLRWALSKSTNETEVVRVRRRQDEAKESWSLIDLLTGENQVWIARLANTPGGTAIKSLLGEKIQVTGLKQYERG